MVFTVLVVGAVLAACLLVRSVPGAPPRGRRPDPRLRYVERHPEQVNAGDVRRLLALELEPAEVRLVAERAAALGIRPWTMHAWIKRFGVPTLALAVAADTTHEELLLHLAEGTLPDLEELAVFAAINGLPATRAVAPSARRGRSARPARPTAPAPALAAPARRTPPAEPAAASAAVAPPRMPQIFEPGSWPFDAAPAQQPLGPTRPGPDGHGSVAA